MGVVGYTTPLLITGQCVGILLTQTVHSFWVSGQSIGWGPRLSLNFVSSPLRELGGIESDRKPDVQPKMSAETLKVSFRPQSSSKINPAVGVLEGIIPVAVRNGRPGTYFQGASS